MRAIEVTDPSQVAEARRAAVTTAQANGFSEEDAGRVAIVASELATNLVKHGAGGVLLVSSFEDETGSGVECMALDKGAGIADIEQSSRDGHSTAGSPGTGLGAVFRGSHVTDVYSAPDRGTAILARMERGRPDTSRSTTMPVHGGVNVALKGEEASGDLWTIAEVPDGYAVMVADGLGHGPIAAEASHAASRSFRRTANALPSEQLSQMHGALRGTRGAAVAIAQVDHAEKQIVFAGVGNIAAAIVDHDGGIRRMVSNNGTIGHIARHMRDFTYPTGNGAIMILASDGIGTSWQLDAYPGLAQRHPALIAGVLFRDFARGRDDATVVVCRLAER